MMKRCVVPIISALVAGFSFSSVALAADWERGEQLHNSQCVSCHASRFGNNGADIYTRANRRIHSQEALKRQVNRCKDNLEITWFDEDVADVVAYLNRTYYKFEQ